MNIKRDSEIAKLYEKYCSGQPLTDQEIEISIKFFDELAQMCYDVGPVFRLAGMEALNVRNGLNSYKVHREYIKRTLV